MNEREHRRALRQARRSARRPGARLKGCGCLCCCLLIIVGLYLGFTRTTGVPHEIFSYGIAGLFACLLLFGLLGALLTRRGREAVGEGVREGVREGLLEWLLESLLDRR
jgi:cell division protein FtsW (lipid II flippase)